MRPSGAREAGRAAVRHALWHAARMLAFAALVATGAAAARPHGVVVNARTGQPIAGAIVTIEGGVQRTNAAGEFDDPDNVRVVAVRAPGYLRAQGTVSGDARVTIALVPFRPKAVYLSAYGVNDPALLDAAVKLRATSAINALVIDAKGDAGATPYPSAARYAAGAVAAAPDETRVRAFAARLADLHRRGFYLIARIVVFKDDPLAAAHPAWAVHDAAGALWRDREGQRWIDPFERRAWETDLDIAEEAAQLGFDEVQFDYVRFPDTRGLRYAQPNTRENRVAALTDFLAAARARLVRYNVFIAADIFGYVCWNTDDTGIGQQLETLGASLDYISPMLYPSGFTWGIPGLSQPTSDPGRIVRRTLQEALRRTGLPAVRFRPWLQAFRDYAFDKRAFGAAEIGAQAAAADALGTDGWMLWNARNRYDALQLPR